MSGCCPDARRLSTTACMDRGLATRRLPPCRIQGRRVDNFEGLWAEFSGGLDEDGRLDCLRFRASACITLVAYCQAAVDLATGADPKRLSELDMGWLVNRLPGVPAMRQDRAALAMAALRGLAVAATAGPGAGADYQFREES